MSKHLSIDDETSNIHIPIGCSYLYMFKILSLSNFIFLKNFNLFELLVWFAYSPSKPLIQASEFLSKWWRKIKVRERVDVGEIKGIIIRKSQANPFKLTYLQAPKNFRERERRVGSFSRRKCTLDWKEKVTVFPWIESVIKHGYLCPHTWFRV